jgi:hypothetical protein
MYDDHRHDIFVIGTRRCARCTSPLGAGASEHQFCTSCLRAADADIAMKRSILLPSEQDADTLSAAF